MLTQQTPLAAAARGAAVLVALTAILVTGCAPRRAEPTAPVPSTAPAAPAIPSGAQVFDVDAARSVVTLRVYRAGPLAKLGHNHVITAGAASGLVWQGREPAGSGFELQVPVNSMVVDDPAARAAAGGGFEGTVPDSAREGTRQNLLRPEVLDGARFQVVTVRCAGLGGTWREPVALADVTLKGVTRRIDVPIAIRHVGGTLEARGAFRLRQSDFGLTPFSVAGGAIQVADEVDLDFVIVATAR